MKVRYTYRCYPTQEQILQLAQVFGCCRYVYNWALNLRKNSYREGIKLSYIDTSVALTRLKQQSDHMWLNDVSCVPTQQALRQLQTAYKNFFEKRSGYPTYKKKRSKQSAEYTKSAFRWDVQNQNLILAKIGRLKIKWSRSFKSSPTTVTITKDPAGRYFVSLVLDETIKPLRKTRKCVGVDLGISRLATLSNGEHIPNPQYFRYYEKKLAQAQKVLSRRKVGSGRWKRQRLRVAKLHAKIVDSRKDYVHKATTALVQRFDVIVMEDLNLRGMVQNGNLSKSISDASMGMFKQYLSYKCNWYGKELRQIDRFYPSSKMCSDCGYIVEKLPLSIREWTCPNCKSKHDRDKNAARNILAAGHVASAHGGSRRRSKSALLQRMTRRSVNQPVEHKVCSSGIPFL